MERVARNAGGDGFKVWPISVHLQQSTFICFLIYWECMRAYRLVLNVLILILGNNRNNNIYAMAMFSQAHCIFWMT